MNNNIPCGLVFGRNGCGKTTLINALSESNADFSLIEASYIQYQRNVNIKTKAYETIEEFSHTDDPNKQISFILYCIPDGARLESFEAEIIESLSSKYYIIMVITQTIRYSNNLQKELGLSVPIVNVLARNVTIHEGIIESFGLDKLINQIHQMDPNYQKQAIDRADQYATIMKREISKRIVENYALIHSIHTTDKLELKQLMMQMIQNIMFVYKHYIPIPVFEKLIDKKVEQCTIKQNDIYSMFWSLLSLITFTDFTEHKSKEVFTQVGNTLINAFEAGNFDIETIYAVL